MWAAGSPESSFKNPVLPVHVQYPSTNASCEKFSVPTNCASFVTSRISVRCSGRKKTSRSSMSASRVSIKSSGEMTSSGAGTSAPRALKILSSCNLLSFT